MSKHKLRGIFLDVIIPSPQSRYSVDRQEDEALDDQSMRQLALPFLLHDGVQQGSGDGRRRFHLCRYRHRRDGHDGHGHREGQRDDHSLDQGRGQRGVHEQGNDGGDGHRHRHCHRHRHHRHRAYDQHSG